MKKYYGLFNYLLLLLPPFIISYGLLALITLSLGSEQEQNSLLYYIGRRFFSFSVAVIIYCTIASAVSYNSIKPRMWVMTRFYSLPVAFTLYQFIFDYLRQMGELLNCIPTFLNWFVLTVFAAIVLVRIYKTDKRSDTDELLDSISVQPDNHQ